MKRTSLHSGKFWLPKRRILSTADLDALPCGGPIIRNATCDRCGQLRPAVVVLGCARICRQCQDTHP